jgi:hypothetical protein
MVREHAAILGKRHVMRGLARQEQLSSRRTCHSGVISAARCRNDYDHLVQSAKKRGAPVESLPVTPVVSRVTPIALGRYAPHPNVGKLFIDFALSEEGQKILRGFGRSSARKGIEPDDLQRKGIKRVTTSPPRTTHATTKNSEKFGEMTQEKQNNRWGDEPMCWWLWTVSGAAGGAGDMFEVVPHLLAKAKSVNGLSEF